MPSEFEIIRRHFARPAQRAVLGVGDDAALLRPAAGMELAVSTDLLIEGRHFRAGAEARKLGHKALAVNLSDMAAMGATPRWATLALALPKADDAWLAAFAEGFYALADRFGVDLVGGDTTRGPALAICVTILGEVPAGRALRRSGAAPGDDVWVSGELGGAAYALAHSKATAAAKRLDEPEPRVALGERLLGIASAAIDVSDGFAQDLGHILEASGVGAIVEWEALPSAPELKKLHDKKQKAKIILSGGDDYELVFTAKKKQRDAIGALAKELALPLTRVGAVEKGNPNLSVVDRHRKPVPVGPGFDHFGK